MRRFALCFGLPYRVVPWLAAHTLIGVCAGCGVEPGSTMSADVLVSVINVTPFDVTAVLSGVRAAEVDTVQREVAPMNTADVTFVCLDSLVVGDPLAPDTPGIVIAAEGEPVEIPPFSVDGGESFVCGDVVEIIISGNDADSFAVDVFVLTPP